jgi:hypothetical protein
MLFRLSRTNQGPAYIVALVVSTACLSVGNPSLAQRSDEADFLPVATSVNALMVALVDHSAHEIWEAGSAPSLTGRDWQTAEQHAIQLTSRSVPSRITRASSADCLRRASIAS